jgi:hypothetical protein
MVMRRVLSRLTLRDWSQPAMAPPPMPPGTPMRKGIQPTRPIWMRVRWRVLKR